MQYKYSLLTAASLVGSSIAAYIPSEPWSTLTPDSPAPSGATTQYTKTFGIAVVPLATESASASKAKRDVISQIGDGQIQATTSTAPTPTSTAQVISQIGDGQIQATTSTASIPKETAQVISQIGDGQIQATTSTASTKSTDVVSQIGDGQIQATSSSASASASSTSSSDDDSNIDVQSTSCLTDSSLALVLKDGILTDAHGRIGSIVANRQFQFDGPPPQAGAIYAAGWSITEDGNLAIGNQTTFYQCLSGNFYNLYDESLGAQCHKIHLEVVDLVNC